MEESKQDSTQQRALGVNDHIDLGFIHRDQQDLELQIQDRKNLKQLKQKILFECQSLGRINLIASEDKILETYVKGVHCEEAIKNLIKFLRSDNNENPCAKLILSEYNIVQNDLIKLLNLYVEDKKLCFWVIALMYLLTNRPSDDLNAREKEIIMRGLRDYKNAFAKHQCLTMLTIHIADYVKLEKQNRYQSHQQMLEFSVLLIRNLVQIDNDQDVHRGLHQHFMMTFLREEMFSPIQYLIQNCSQLNLVTKLAIPLLEIAFYVFTCFSPKDIFEVKEQKSYQRINKLSQLRMSSRHSRFMPNFQRRDETGKLKLRNSLNQSSDSDKTTNRRKIVIKSKLLKGTNSKRDTLSQNFLELLCEGSEGQIQRVRDMVGGITKEFMEVELEKLTAVVFPLIQNSEKATEQNLIQYFHLCSWSIEMTRNKYKRDCLLAEPSQRRNVEFDLSQIACIMHTSHFQLLYRTIFRAVSKVLRIRFKFKLFDGGLKMFLNYLNCLWDLFQSGSISDRKNANFLMANLFKHDVANIFKNAFDLIQEEYLLKILIMVCFKFFKLLQDYAKGRVITIRTNRQLKPKMKKSTVREHQNEGQHEEWRQYAENQPTQTQKKKTSAEIYEERAEQLRFQERKCNLISQFSIITSYEIIQKYLIFIRNEGYSKNDKELNNAIFFYFEHICTLLKGEWLFYQADTLCQFQNILAHEQFCQVNPKIKTVVEHICKGFLQLLKNNQLALVESLFRYQKIDIKDQILKNYGQTQIEPAQSLLVRHTNIGAMTQNFTGTFDARTSNFKINQQVMGSPIFGDSQFMGSVDPRYNQIKDLCIQRTKILNVKYHQNFIIFSWPFCPQELHSVLFPLASELQMAQHQIFDVLVYQIIRFSVCCSKTWQSFRSKLNLAIARLIFTFESKLILRQCFALSALAPYLKFW